MCKIFQGFFSFLCEVFFCPYFRGFLFLLCDAFGPCPSKIFQGFLSYVFVSCPSEIFSRGTFIFLPHANIFTGCFCFFLDPLKYFHRMFLFFFLPPSNIFKGSQCPSALPPPPPAAAPLSYNICNICVFKSLNCLV